MKQRIIIDSICSSIKECELKPESNSAQSGKLFQHIFFLFPWISIGLVFFFCFCHLMILCGVVFFYTVLSFCGRSSLKSTQRDKNAKYFHRKFCVSKKSWFHIFFFFLCLFFSKPSSSMKINIIKLIFLSLTKRCKGHVESFFNLYWTHFIGLG